MYVGHLAIALALKALLPHIPSFVIIVGTAWLDILDGIFILFGWNSITPNLSAGPYLFFNLTFIDWDHSLLMASLLSLLWALICFKLYNNNNQQIAIIAAISSMSHWVSDWPMHNEDLALYPFSNYHFGYNLWGKLGLFSWYLEILFVILLSSFSYFLNSKRGVSWKYVYYFLVFLTFNLSPWTSPMQFVATLSRPLSDIIGGILITLGFVLPSYVLCRLVDSAEQKAKKH